ncbi:DUF1302 domain-containing protein [Oceanicoccus sagamiensis]|uniref:DUF1302 domain-containing protein n=1 Tax=Oceanicoccus sagamiensis TaxID=716816 RepID=A0A1X9NB50_9GAMM|nr:DUF1302 family protein [Oceanicoccus sagamiensis]ARN74274.1 hypothetical protein BST96_09155 [Oceanicoccus sagamiensis]
MINKQPQLVWVWLVAISLPMNAAAFDYRDADTGIEVLFDFEAAYGFRMRTEDTDLSLVSPAHGGTRLAAGRSGNLDDGTLNYDKGELVSNMFRATGELTVGWRNLGLFIRGYAFYDYENERNDRERTELGKVALDQVGSDAELLDVYLSARFTVSEVPLHLRLGDQVVTWGESRFFPGSGVDVANPMNIPLYQQPTSTLRDLRKPVGMLWGTAQITPQLIIEAYYQYDWEESELPASGTYFSSNDAAPQDGAFIQAEGFASQFGTNLSEFYGIPAETLEAVGIQAFDPNFYQVTQRLPDDSASDSGQFGVTVQTILTHFNDSKIALHYAQYHAKLPSFGLVGPSLSNYVTGYSEPGIEKLKRELIREGAGPVKSTAAATLTQLSAALNDASFFYQYPDDIEMLGLSFNTTTMGTGTAYFGEVAHHFDVPMPIHSGDVLPDIIPGATREDPLPPVDLNQFTLAELATEYANVRIDPIIYLDKTFALIGATQFLGPLLGASQTLVNIEFASLTIWDMPDRSELFLAGPGLAVTDFKPRSAFASSSSWGYRVGGGMQYNNVYGGINLRPRILWAHDVYGVSPVGVGPFLEGRKALTLGLQAEYLARLKLDIAYTQYSGADQWNLINDRDNLSFSVRYDF